MSNLKDAKDNKLSNLRRNFLLGATFGTAGAVAAVVTKGAGEAIQVATAVPVAGEVKKVKGYHLSEHIAQYYDTTRI